MSGPLSILALAVSAILLAGMIAMLVLLRRGEGPQYGASRAYDRNRRSALHALTGQEVDRVPGEQWYEPARRRTIPDDPISAPFREAVHEALRAIVPAGRDLSFDDRGRAWLGSERAWVVPAVSTAELREENLDTLGADAALVVGLVLFNPEPPGGDAKRVALPIQAVFPALRDAGREDLVARFEELRGRSANERAG